MTVENRASTGPSSTNNLSDSETGEANSTSLDPGSASSGHGSLPSGRIEITARRWAWLLELCGLSAGDLSLLAGAFSDAELRELSKAVGRVFDDNVRAHPEIQALIESTTTVPNMQERLERYVGSSFSESFDDDRVDSLVRIGRVHNSVGVPMAYHLGALAGMDEVLIPALVDRFGDDPKTLSRILLAYRRLCTCDLGIVLQTFTEERDPTTSARIGHFGLSE